MSQRGVKSAVAPLLFLVVATLLSLFGIDMAKITPEQMEQLQALVIPEPKISSHDDIFRSVGERYDVDWLLLAAIARAESEFRVDAVSKAGAVGLMQIMPSVARNMGYEREVLFDATVNVEIAAQLLHDNNRMLRLSEEFDSEERLNFILACYNAGYSRISDARRLARYHEDDANRWSVVSSYLELLSEPEFAEHEVVKSGAFHGSDETIIYVKKVMRIYKRYRNKMKELTPPSTQCQVRELA